MSTYPDGYATRISIHALREEGDCDPFHDVPLLNPFLSTPSARRATQSPLTTARTWPISIHALREEGDQGRPRRKRDAGYFYPRPPRGGRRAGAKVPALLFIFLSTPSARRATCKTALANHWEVFLSTPSARRATGHRRDQHPYPQAISIHALREEGDR